ncbi:MAG: isoaspartyl peptidase/L-asparaginase [Thermoflexales bacterium]|nr:isoaspartyl peptidase/L-asparaginase [Thermoflexales bacterium]
MLMPVLLANAEVRDEYLIAGMRMLREGAHAGDVAEYVARLVEDDPEEHTVGYGGYPNVLGEGELDASFMDGTTLQAGAVAALKGFRHPISVAREVMRRLPHVLLVGEGAARFAREIGAEPREMLSPEARRAWQEHVGMLRDAPDTIALTWQAWRHARGHDTMNVIARDMHGNLCTAVSTSGVAWKYPGRVGDSPLIGAGNYCDSRYGAATCMGLGEAAMRLAAAAQAVTLLRLGWSLVAAGVEVTRQLAQLLGRSRAEHPMRVADWVRVLIMDAQGNVGGFATRDDLCYKVITAETATPLTQRVMCVSVG